MTAGEHITQIAERYAGPIGGWAVQALVWAFSGMNLITALGAVAALWWTVERALAERARRRTEEARISVFEDYAEERREAGMLKRIYDRVTKPGDLT